MSYLLIVKRFELYGFNAIQNKYIIIIITWAVFSLSDSGREGRASTRSLVMTALRQTRPELTGSVDTRAWQDSGQTSTTRSQKLDRKRTTIKRIKLNNEGYTCRPKWRFLLHIIVEWLKWYTNKWFY